MRVTGPSRVLLLAASSALLAVGPTSGASADPGGGVAASRADGCPALVTSSTVSPSTLYDGDRALQTITLDRPAPAGGQFVDLSGTNYGYTWSTRLDARVPEGRRSVTVPVRFTGAPTTLVVDDLDVGAGCDAGYVDVNDVTVLPLDPARLAVAQVTLDRQTAVAGDSLRAVVRLSAPARPGGTSVRVSSGSLYDAGLVGWPRVVTVPGGQTTVGFPLSVSDVLPAATRPGLSASNGTSSASTRVLVVPDTLAVSRTLRPDRPVTQLLLSLGRRAPAGGAVVRIGTTIRGLRVPATVTVPAGAYSVRFPVTRTRTDTTGLLTATWAGQTYRGQLYLSYTEE